MSHPDSRADWWLSTTGTPEGPYSVAFVRAGLRSGAIPATSHACRVRGDTWKPAPEWVEFQDVALPASRQAGTDAETSSLADFSLTNPKLSAMANAICIYSIAVAPILFLISQFSCVATGTTYKETSNYIGWEIVEFLLRGVVSLISTVLLVIGGLRLRRLSGSGPRLILTAVWFSIAAGFLLFAVSLGVLASASQEDMAESTTAGTILSLVFLILGIAEFAFLVTSLIWLHRNQRSLPLTNA